VRDGTDGRQPGRPDVFALSRECLHHPVFGDLALGRKPDEDRGEIVRRAPQPFRADLDHEEDRPVVYPVHLRHGRVKGIGQGGEVRKTTPKGLAALDDVSASVGVGDEGPHIRVDGRPGRRHIGRLHCPYEAADEVAGRLCGHDPVLLVGVRPGRPCFRGLRGLERLGAVSRRSTTPWASPSGTARRAQLRHGSPSSSMRGY
jgi:hypothetical protein